jgi:hypothetical protein
MFELAASEDTRVGVATKSVNEEVVGKENDAGGVTSVHEIYDTTHTTTPAACVNI